MTVRAAGVYKLVPLPDPILTSCPRTHMSGPKQLLHQLPAPPSLPASLPVSTLSLITSSSTSTSSSTNYQLLHQLPAPSPVTVPLPPVPAKTKHANDLSPLPFAPSWPGCPTLRVVPMCLWSTERVLKALGWCCFREGTVPHYVL